MYTLLAIMLTCGIVTLNAVESPIHIAPWQGNRQGAFSFTFDDGWKGQVDNTLEIIDPLGITGTFFFMPLAMEQNPKSHADWQQTQAMQAAGHEIGTHARVKPRLHEADEATLEERVNGGWRLITEKTGIAPVSFALPGGTKLTDTVRDRILEHHSFIRKPNTFPAIAEVVSYGAAGRRTWQPQRERDRIEQAIANGKWRICVIHAIVAGYSPFPSKEAFREHCEWVKAQEDRLWIAPMGTVGRYIAARQASTLTIKEHTANGCRFTLTAPADRRELFTEPLTVVIPVEASAATAVDANGTALPVTLTDSAILVAVLPHDTTVTVTW